jgi:hypothetical protein
VAVGDLLTYTVEVPLAAGESVAGPGAEAKFGAWEVRGYREERGTDRTRLIYTLTAFEPGERPIPAIEIRLAAPGGRTRTVRTALVTVRVASVLKLGDEKPADIVGPLSLREKPLAVVLRTAAVLVIALAVAALLVFAWRRLRRRAAAKPTPLDPPDVAALKALARLRAAGLPEKGKVKSHYTELSDILREYLAARYGVRTLEETTSRIVRALRAHPEAAEHAARFEDLLRESDLVKFAKARPDATACHTAVDAAAALVRGTAAALPRSEGGS